MPNRTSKTGSELFIVDNSDADWKVLRYLHDWCQISRQFDIASGYFELGALLGLKEEWQKVDKIRILMGEEVSLRTREAFAQGLRRMHHKLDQSLEAEKLHNDFLLGVPAVVDGIKSGKIECRVYRKEKVPRQGLHHPRPPGGRRLRRPCGLLQLHLRRHHPEHRTERSDHRPAGHRVEELNAVLALLENGAAK